MVMNDPNKDGLKVFNVSPPNQYAVSLHCYGRDLRQTDRLVFNTTEHTSAKHPNDEFIAFKDFVDQIYCLLFCNEVAAGGVGLSKGGVGFGSVLSGEANSGREDEQEGSNDTEEN